MIETKALARIAVGVLVALMGVIVMRMLNCADIGCDADPTSGLMYFVVAVGAGIGGFLCADFFGKRRVNRWISAVLVLLGAVLSTAIAAAIVGAFSVVPEMANFPQSLAIIPFAPAMVFYALFQVPLVGVVWCVGFTVLHFVIRKIRDMGAPD